jgi:hypothetical protein
MRGRKKMIFDATISMGSIVNAVALLVGFVVAFTRIGGRLDLLSMRLASVEDAIKKSSDQDKRITTLEERLTNQISMLTTVTRDLSSMRRGEGFITGHRQGTDGEH